MCVGKSTDIQESAVYNSVALVLVVVLVGVLLLQPSANAARLLAHTPHRVDSGLDEALAILLLLFFVLVAMANFLDGSWHRDAQMESARARDDITDSIETPIRTDGVR